MSSIQNIEIKSNDILYLQIVAAKIANQCHISKWLRVMEKQLIKGAHDYWWGSNSITFSCIDHRIYERTGQGFFCIIERRFDITVYWTIFWGWNIARCLALKLIFWSRTIKSVKTNISYWLGTRDRNGDIGQYNGRYL